MSFIKDGMAEIRAGLQELANTGNSIPLRSVAHYIGPLLNELETFRNGADECHYELLESVNCYLCHPANRAESNITIRDEDLIPNDYVIRTEGKPTVLVFHLEK